MFVNGLIRCLNWKVIACCFLLTACADPIPDSIKGDSGTPQENFISVHNTPAIFIGQEARFGGRVIAVKNENAGKTRLEISAIQLDSGAKPILGQASQGRFVAYVPAFLEPTDYNGQLITVIGKISGSEQGKIGDTDYSYVTLDATGFQRWQVRQQIIMPMGPPFGMYGGFGHRPWGPYRGPYWGWDGWYGPPGPVQVQSVVTE